ncbi:MAG: class I SAM-dependent methyltransferase [Rubripirellula sp.]
MINSVAIGSLLTALIAIVTAMDAKRKAKQAASQLESLQSECNRVAQRIAEFDPAAFRALRDAGNQQQQAVGSLEQRMAHCQTEVDHLRVEDQNLAMLPTWHPTRVQLAAELRPRLAPITDRLEPVLFPNQLAFDELDWMYRLPDRKFPYSLTFEEGMMFHYLVAANDLRSGYEIATAFGLSSFFLATAFEKTSGHLLSVDAYIEEELEDFIYDLESTRRHVEKIRGLQQERRHDLLPRGLQFALEGAATLKIESVVDYRVGCSPEGVPELLGDRQLDFAFIDGGHFGEQPVLDVQSVLPSLNPTKFLMMFHDTQCEAVAKAVHFAATETQCKPVSIHTRNRIVAVARGIDFETLATCREMTVRQAS